MISCACTALAPLSHTGVPCPPCEGLGISARCSGWKGHVSRAQGTPSSLPLVGHSAGGGPQSLPHIFDGDVQHSVLYRGVPAPPPASPVTCLSPLGAGTALPSLWALPSLRWCCQGCATAGTSGAAGEATAGPQVPAMPPQGLQCQRSLKSILQGSRGSRAGCSFLWGLWPRQPPTPSWHPACLALSANPSITPSRCQKRSFPLHCSPLMSPTHQQVPIPPMALEEPGGQQGVAAWWPAADMPLSASKSAKAPCCGL